MSKKSEKKLIKTARNTLDAVEVLTNKAIQQVNIDAAQAFRIFEQQAATAQAAAAKPAAADARNPHSVDALEAAQMTPAQQCEQLKKLNPYVAAAYYSRHMRAIEDELFNPSKK
jgi:hypothetical protein